MADAVLHLPSAGPDPLPVGTALAAILGYARGRRPLRFRSPSHPHGTWVSIPAFAHERFDARARLTGPLGEPDILVAESLHGRLDRPGWAALRTALDDAAPVADAVVARAAGRAFWELPDDEFSVLAEPGTVGALLRDLPGDRPGYVAAALHHRRPELVPLLSRTTRWQLLPHVREGDSGVEAVISRELRANAEAFGRLEHAVVDALGTPLTRLRLHDVLLWLSGSLRLTHAVQLGVDTREWAGRHWPDVPGATAASDPTSSLFTSS